MSVYFDIVKFLENAVLNVVNFTAQVCKIFFFL